MKLFKSLGVLVFAISLFAFSGCTTSFCSDEDVANITNAIVAKLETNTGEDVYTTQPTAEEIKSADIVVDGVAEPTWSDLTSEQKYTYAKKVYDSNHPKSCLVTGKEKDVKTEVVGDEEVRYYIDQSTGARIEAKSFGYAFKQGLLEILAYPVSWGMIIVGGWLGGNGYAILAAIFLVTFIIRGLMLGVTWRSTKQSQKLQSLQPQMNAINAKYANRNDPQSKNLKAQEMMNLYKKNKVNPLTSLISPFLTLPVFIATYGAIRDTAIVYEGSVFNITLGTKLGDLILKFNAVGIITFVLMIACQFITMKLPQWLSKKKMPEHMRKGAQNQGFSQQNAMTYFFLIMIVIIGWMLPIAMSIYWIASSLFSLGQSFLMQSISKPANLKENYR